MLSKCFFFRTMAMKGLRSDQIEEILMGLPSDYEEDTDEEDVDTTYMIESALDFAQNLISEEQENITLETDYNNNQNEEIIININSSESSLPNDHHNERENCQEKRKWKKKTEPALDISFHDTSKVVHQFVNTPLDAFNIFMNEDIIDKIHYETNLKSVQKGKPISLNKRGAQSLYWY